MSKEKSRDVVSSRGGVFHDLSNQIKLIVRLLGDPRVNPLLKLLPIGSLIYLIIPDIVPGPIDDAIIVWLGSCLFIELCPPDVVQEHQEELNQVIPGQWQDVDGEVIDGEARDVD